MRRLILSLLVLFAGVSGRSAEPSASAYAAARSSVANPAKSASRDDGAPKAIFDWPTGRKLVALTFDDGPNARYTPDLVRLLERKKAKATFFVQGEMLRANPSVAAAQVSPLFEIANHGYDHKQFTKLSDSGVVSQLSRTEELIASVTGRKAALVRPPYGSADARVRRICEQQGYKVILWDIDTNDWRGRSVENMRQNILSNVRDGSIILMHDHFRASHETTAIIIDELRARGFEFATVSEMLSFPRTEMVTSAPKTPASGRSKGMTASGSR